MEMRTSLIVLLGTTLGLGIACVYLVGELSEERARSRTARQQSAILEAKLSERERSTAKIRGITVSAELHPKTSMNQPGPTASESKPSAELSEAERATKNGRTYQARRMQALADPAAHATMRESQEPGTRRFYRGLAKALDISATQEDQVIELLTEQELVAEEFNYRLQGKQPDEDKSRRAIEEFQLEQRNELVALLGEEKTQRLEQYQKTIHERLQMNALRARLDGANQLTDDQENQLIGQMQQERASYIQSLRGEGAGMFLGEYPFTAMSVSVDPKERLAKDKAYLQMTEEFLHRIHEHAAGVLTVEQLRRFDEIQGEHLSQARLGIQRQEAAAAGHKVPW
jgi:hypothetical protein